MDEAETTLSGNVFYTVYLRSGNQYGSATDSLKGNDRVQNCVIVYRLSSFSTHIETVNKSTHYYCNGAVSQTEQTYRLSRSSSLRPWTFTCSHTAIRSSALPFNGLRPIIHELLLIYRPRRDERLSWPSWLTYSGHFTNKVVIIDQAAKD